MLLSCGLSLCFFSGCSCAGNGGGGSSSSVSSSTSAIGEGNSSQNSSDSSMDSSMDSSVDEQPFEGNSIITYDADNGTVETSTQTVAYGQSYRLAEATHAGYNFLGWQYNGKNIEQEGTWDIKEENVTLTAQWSPKTFRITYDVGDNPAASLVYDYVEVQYKQTFELQIPLNDDTSQGFLYWRIKGTDTIFTEGTYLLTESVELVAEWESRGWTPLG